MKPMKTTSGRSLADVVAERRGQDWPASAAAALRYDANAGRRELIAASLAGGIIAASGKPHSVEEAIAVMRKVADALLAPAGGEAA